MNKTNVVSQLVNILDSNRVLFDDESKLIYGKDLTQNYSPNPLAIVFPKIEQEIIEIVKLANATKTSLVPSGGRTGYSGGAVAMNQEIVVSFKKMNRILDFNAADRLITCEAGVITKTLQDFALQNNLFYPIDLASSGSCQIGGNIATNAGGIKVIRYGLTRDWVAGLKVVTGNGDLLELNHGLTKNSTGYDLRHLFIGSEGTLGLITQATLKLTTAPSAIKVMLFAVPDKNHFIDLLKIFNTTLTITAFEFFSEAAIRYMMSETKLPHPFFSIVTPFYILLEYESDNESDNSAMILAEKCINDKIVIDVLISENLQHAKNFWRYREEISMSLLKFSPYKYDIAVLPSKVATFIYDVDKLFASIYPDMEIVWFGHIGDGNLHLNILKPSKLSKEQFFSYCHQMSEPLYTLVQKYHGTVSAEHGIGLLKKDFLHYAKSKAEIDYMRAIKNIFDRNNLMNPGKLI